MTQGHFLILILDANQVTYTHVNVCAPNYKMLQLCKYLQWILPRANAHLIKLWISFFIRIIFIKFGDANMELNRTPTSHPLKSPTIV